MTRTPTTTDTTVEWEEKVTDPDSDQLTITLELDAVDDGSGFTDDGTDSSNLSWLSFSKDKSTLADGTTEVLVNIVADKSGLDQGYSYRFKITADDGTTAVDRTFTLSIEQPSIDGSTMYSINPDQSEIYQHNVSTPWDLTTASTANKTVNTISGDFDFGITVPQSGDYLFISTRDGDILARYEFGTKWNIDTLQNEKTWSITDIGATSIWVSRDGTRLFIGGWSPDGVLAYDLSTPFDFASATQVGTLSAPDNVDGFWVREDGKKVYVMTIDDDVYEYDLSTAFDLGSATQKSNLNSANTDNLTRNTGISYSTSGLYLKPDGTKVYAFFEEGRLEVFSLSTAWDLSTATFEYETQSLAGSGTDAGNYTFGVI